jgi:uncharacterized SAM-binding protein YcdF (DUF218 family)
MPALRSQTGKGEGRMTRGGGVMRALGLSVAAIACGFALFVAGFLLFLWYVPDHEIALDRKADGIVVLTGGASRIEDAIELLASGRGQRLLITGVHRATSQREIARLRPEHQKAFGCCVDLDRSAVNTVGNATETKRWATERGFKSLIVVTSNYHMPRAMAELSHQLPDAALIPFPVVTEQSRPHWSNGATLRLFFLEYVKYTVAIVRMRLPAFA